MIACVVIADFVALVEGQGNPLLLLSTNERVRAASASAVQLGVRLSMTRRQAQTLCPGAEIVPLDTNRYLEQAEAVYRCLTRFTHVIEGITGFWNSSKRSRETLLHPSSAVWYLDLGKLTRQDGLVVAHKIAQAMWKDIKTPVLIGLARGKFPASIAVRHAKPDTPKLIRPGYEARFLASHPVTLLPLEREMSRRLTLLGITTLGQFAALPKAAVTEQFGTRGRFFHELASGQDTRPVAATPPPAKEVIARVFEGPIEQRQFLVEALHIIAIELSERLQAQQKTTQELRLQLQLDDGQEQVSRQVLRQASQERHFLGRMLVRLVDQHPIASGVGGLEVTATQLMPVVPRQLELFISPNPLDCRLSELLEQMVTRFGSEDIYRIEERNPDGWLTEDRFTIQDTQAA